MLSNDTGKCIQRRQASSGKIRCRPFLFWSVLANHFPVSAKRAILFLGELFGVSHQELGTISALQKQETRGTSSMDKAI